MANARRQRRDGGFTLIELVTVLVILGILAVFAMSRLDFTSAFQQRGVRDKLQAGLEFARKAAVAHRRNVCVCVGATCAPADSAVFTLDTRAPETTGITFCNGSSEVALALPAPDRDCAAAGNAVCSRTQGNGVTIGHVSGGPTFRFDAQGGASATVVVSVSGESNVTVESQTGYVHP